MIQQKFIQGKPFLQQAIHPLSTLPCKLRLQLERYCITRAPSDEQVHRLLRHSLHPSINCRNMSKATYLMAASSSPPVISGVRSHVLFGQTSHKVHMVNPWKVLAIAGSIDCHNSKFISALDKSSRPLRAAGCCGPPGL